MVVGTCLGRRRSSVGTRHHLPLAERSSSSLLDDTFLAWRLSSGVPTDLIRRSLDRYSDIYCIRELNACRARHTSIWERESEPVPVRGRREAS